VKHDAKSRLEKEFASQIARYKLPEPVREFPFAREAFGRRYRLDFYWDAYKLGVELHGLIVLQGGIVRGGHGTVPGMTRDMDKKNAAILLGIDVLTFTQSHVTSHAAIQMTMRALTVKGLRWNDAPTHAQA
jgi:hypothetical protein